MITKQARLPEISESEWSAQFEQLFTCLGWRGYHTHDSRRSEPGFPDWHLRNVSQSRIILVELKKQSGGLSPDQVMVIGELRACGAEVYVWRPSDYEEACRTLRGR